MMFSEIKPPKNPYVKSELDQTILAMLSDKPRQLAELLINDEEVKALQVYANIVSVKRLGFNEHGPIHMRKVTINAIKIATLLTEVKIKLSLEEEGVGTLEDSLCALVLAGFLHDIGMTLTRSLHEQTALTLAYPLLTVLLEKVYGNDPKRFIVRSLTLEAILGHMAVSKIFSYEAGIILLADGCDMERDRARIPLINSLHNEGRAGDIHKYSADAIEKVMISAGEKKPIRIEVLMTSLAGLFQVEEVLLPKANQSPIKPYIELVTLLDENNYKQYI